jgi:riboflavin kinase/FMN adenylyltransferase
MDLFRTLQRLREVDLDGACLTVGVFDGVHRGHQMLLAATIEHARRLGVPALVLTFADHPLRLLAPPYAPPLLTTAEEKADLLRAHGADLCLMLDFDAALAATPPAAFLEEIVAGVCRARRIVCGGDFRFGSAGGGDVELLRRMGPELGYEVDVRDDLMEGNAAVRSSRVRSRLLEGDVEEARLLLGRPYSLTGIVTAGDRRGRRIGYPTANLVPPEGRLAPQNGVYAVRGELPDGSRHGGMANIGVRPTFGSDRRTIEAHLFDFEGDLYDRRISVQFLRKIREERRFESPQALIEQLRADEKVCRSILSG